MNLPKFPTVGALALAGVLSLTACTGGGPAPAEKSKGIEISVASGNTPTGQALGKIYAQALRTAGYQVTEPAAGANPYQQVLDGHSDVAIDKADAAAIEGFKAGEKPVHPLDASAAISSPVLVMSQAEATFHGVDSVPSLAAACQKLEFVGVQPRSDALHEALTAAGCAKPRYKTVPAAQLATQLRASLNRVLVLDSADAIIGDEGFEVIEGSEDIFEAQPLVPLADERLEEDAQNVINQVTKKLDQPALIGINRMVTGADALDPKTAANRFKVLTQ